MSILWCGGEDTDFSGIDDVHFRCVTTGGYFRSGYARAAVEGMPSGGLGYAKSSDFTGGEITTGWMTVQYKYITSAATSRLLWGFHDSDTTCSGIYVGTSSTSSSKWSIYTYDGVTPSELASETGTSISTVIAKMDLYVVYNGGSSTIKLYKDGVELISWSGDATISGVSGFDKVILYNTSGHNSAFSEFIVSDADTRAFSLHTAYPNAAGTTNQWDGAYTDIDEYKLDTSDSMYTDTNAEVAEVNLDNLPAGNFNIICTKIVASCCQSTGSSISQIKLGYYTNSTLSVDAGRSVTTAPYYTTYERYDHTNPVTTDPWTEAEIDALQLAFESLT